MAPASHCTFARAAPFLPSGSWKRSLAPRLLTCRADRQVTTHIWIMSGCAWPICTMDGMCSNGSLGNSQGRRSSLAEFACGEILLLGAANSIMGWWWHLLYDEDMIHVGRRLWCAVRSMNSAGSVWCFGVASRRVGGLLLIPLVPT